MGSDVDETNETNKAGDDSPAQGVGFGAPRVAEGWMLKGRHSFVSYALQPGER